MTDDGALDAGRLRALFEEMSAELSQRGEQVQMFVVGGAAMALAYDQTRLTQDVDAAFEPSQVVRELAAIIGQRHGLEPDWLNDAAKGFLPGNDTKSRTVFETESLLVQVPSPEYLLAMKLYSGREGRDREDAVKLYAIAGYTTPDEGMSLLVATFRADRLEPRHRYIVEEVAAASAELGTD